VWSAIAITAVIKGTVLALLFAARQRKALTGPPRDAVQ
jgi:hypothetical protein